MGGGTQGTQPAPPGASAAQDVPGRGGKERSQRGLLSVRPASCHPQEGVTQALAPGTPVRPGQGLDSSQRLSDSWVLGPLGS